MTADFDILRFSFKDIKAKVEIGKFADEESGTIPYYMEINSPYSITESGGILPTSDKISFVMRRVFTLVNIRRQKSPNPSHHTKPLTHHLEIKG